jgi:hypothetical protein
MNICAKINQLARPDGLVIGQNLFNIVSGLGGYVFTEVAREWSSSGKSGYGAYHVDAEGHTHVINPFERKALF